MNNNRLSRLAGHHEFWLGLLVVALAVIACGAILRLGWRKGLISLVPSVLSLGCGLAVLAMSGQAVNLFSLLALAPSLLVG